MAGNLKAAIYDSDGSEVTGFSSLKITITRTARVIGAPVESGQTSFDNKVIDPTKVVASGIITIDSEKKYKSTISKLNKMFTNREFKFYSVCDGSSFARNLILVQFPIIRDVDKYDFLNIELAFQEAMMIQSDAMKTADSDNADTRDTGYQSGTSVDSGFPI